MRVPTLRLLIPSVTFCALAVALVGTGVRAQTDLDAGKIGPQLFAQDCAACHRSPQGLLKNISSFGLVGFLRQHYTSSSASANTVAAYLQGVANARAPDPKKGKGTEQQQQQAKQSPPGQARTAPATEAPPAQAARPGEPATEHERASRRPPRKQGPAETAFDAGTRACDRRGAAGSGRARYCGGARAGETSCRRPGGARLRRASAVAARNARPSPDVISGWPQAKRPLTPSSPRLPRRLRPPRASRRRLRPARSPRRPRPRRRGLHAAPSRPRRARAARPRRRCAPHGP